MIYNKKSNHLDGFKLNKECDVKENIISYYWLVILTTLNLGHSEYY